MQIDRPRLADLAKHAKVSIATASRVINQKPGVAERTRRSVYTSAAELGIEIPGLETSKQPVAILTPELNNPSFPAFAQNIDTLLAANNRPSILCPAGPEGTTEAQHVQMLLQMNISGAIAVSGMPADTLSSVAPYELLINSGVPVVFINSYSSDLAATFYSTSDEEGVRAAITHLSSLGHQKIGLAIGSMRYLPSQRKREAFHNAGFGAASVSTTDYTVEGGQLAANKLIATGHTAIICGSDMMALGAIRASNALGLSVPEDISVIGYDDSPLMAFTDPPLTTVRQPVESISRAAVKSVLNPEQQHTESTEFMFHPDLIIRGSTGAIS